MAVKFTLTLSFIFLLNVAALASGNLRLLFNDDRGLQETRKLSENLHLSEPVFNEVKMLNDKKYKELDQVGVDCEQEPATRDKMITEIKSYYETKIREYLSPSQANEYTAYLNLVNSASMTDSK